MARRKPSRNSADEAFMAIRMPLQSSDDEAPMARRRHQPMKKSNSRKTCPVPRNENCSTQEDDITISEISILREGLMSKLDMRTKYGKKRAKKPFIDSVSGFKAPKCSGGAFSPGEHDSGFEPLMVLPPVREEKRGRKRKKVRRRRGKGKSSSLI